MDTAQIIKGSESALTEANGYFIKEVARTGEYTTMNGDDVVITMEYLNDLVKNFQTNTDKVFVPLGHPRLQEDAKGLYYYADPLKNCGWVEEVWTKDNSLYAKFKITEPTIAEKIKNGTIADDSIGAYETDDGRNILEHIALTLTPAITELAPFEPVAFEGGKRQYRILERAIKKETTKMENFEKERIELEKSFAEKELALRTEFEKKAKEKEMALELAQKELKSYQEKEVEAVVNSLILEKKIKPVQKESAMALMGINREEFEKFVAENSVIEETLVVHEQKSAESNLEKMSVKEFKALKGSKAVDALEKLHKGTLIVA